jgi:hypothetical protein
VEGGAAVEGRAAESESVFARVGDRLERVDLRRRMARLALCRSVLPQQSERMLLALDNASSTTRINALLPAAAQLIAGALYTSDEGDDRSVREPQAP